MNYKTFSKTLLGIYNTLDAVCERIDKMVNTKALAGIGIDCDYYKNPLDLFNAIIDLNERKVNLINLKLRIEQAISKLNEKEGKVIILKYVDKLTFQQIANLTNQSLRNCFRICDNAIINFGKILKNDGLTEEKIEQCYSSEKWIFQICDREDNDNLKVNKTESINYFKPPTITGRDIVKIASKSVLALSE